MKKFKKIMFVFILMFLIVPAIEAENFTCKIGNYNVEYDTNGNIVGATSPSGAVSAIYFQSYFKPTRVEDCPTDEEAKISIIDLGRTFKVGSMEEYIKAQKEEDKGGCSGYKYEESCEYNKYYACIWNEITLNGKKHTYCNTDELKYVQCGDAFDIPYEVPGLISLAVNLLKIATPIVLIIVSIISLLKAVSASNEDEIKKAQKGLIRKMIAAAMVFFVISIVQFVMLKVADSGESKDLTTCLSCFLNNKCKNNMYYKTNVLGEYQCTYFENPGKPVKCKGNK